MDMKPTIIPKSTQLNADDLLPGPRTICITNVSIKPGEQPVAISFEGDIGRSWFPCKSMCRLLVQLWGADAKIYAGRRLTLVRDPSVTWGGMAVGGIRVSHMSNIGDKPITVILTASKTKRVPYVVQPLAVGKSPASSAGPMITKFAALGVTQAAIERRIGHPVDDITEADMADLRGVFRSITDGAPASQFFHDEQPAPGETPGEPVQVEQEAAAAELLQALDEAESKADLVSVGRLIGEARERLGPLYERVRDQHTAKTRMAK